MRDLIIYLKKIGADHPELQSELQGIYELAKYEIDDGGSVEGELELAYSAVNDLLKGV